MNWSPLSLAHSDHAINRTLAWPLRLDVLSSMMIVVVNGEMIDGWSSKISNRKIFKDCSSQTARKFLGFNGQLLTMRHTCRYLNWFGKSPRNMKHKVFSAFLQAIKSDSVDLPCCDWKWKCLRAWFHDIATIEICFRPNIMLCCAVYFLLLRLIFPFNSTFLFSTLSDNMMEEVSLYRASKFGRIHSLKLCTWIRNVGGIQFFSKSWTAVLVRKGPRKFHEEYNFKIPWVCSGSIDEETLLRASKFFAYSCQHFWEWPQMLNERESLLYHCRTRNHGFVLEDLVWAAHQMAKVVYGCLFGTSYWIAGHLIST